MRRKTLTDLSVARLKAKPKRYAVADPALAGHYVRVQPTGAKSYVAVTYAPGGKQTWATIGDTDGLSIDQAREKAREAVQRVKEGLTPFERPVKGSTFGEVSGSWLRRHVQAKGLRSERQLTRLLDTLILPSWKNRA